jgi:hypothetical protein
MLPLPAPSLTALLVESILARVLATEQVVVCCYVWMANDRHMQLFASNVSSLATLHGRVKKRIPEQSGLCR